MALCALIGIALGGALAVSLGVPNDVTRADLRLIWPLAARDNRVGDRVCRCANNGLWWRVAVACALIFGFAAHAARRVAAPAGDISRLARLPAKINGPLVAPVAVVRGIVADYPRRAEFNTQFPLDCRGQYAGRIWVRAPFNFPAFASATKLRCCWNSNRCKARLIPANATIFGVRLAQNCWVEGNLYRAPRQRAQWRIVQARRGFAGRARR